MKTLFLFLFLTTLPVFGYNVYSPDNYSYKNEDKVLFILDFSNSMTEYLDGETKLDMMLKTMYEILPQIDNNTLIGLRVYGHKGGFTAMNACRASSLIVPVERANSNKIGTALKNLNPRGMTPITYSLKQSVNEDFAGISGKKRIILLTDGGENCDESPCEYVMKLIKTRKDISIDVIAFNINDEDDLEQLKCTALVTSGKFYTANTAAELAKSLNSSLTVKKDVDAKIISNY